MGLRLGFQTPSPFDRANTSGPGEDGYFVNLHPRPRPDLPLRAVVRTPCASAAFDSPGDARLYLEHPGEIPTLAAHYLGWAAATPKEDRP